MLEAVFEETAVKQEVFAAAESVVRADCIFATNTSALSVTRARRGSSRIPSAWSACTSSTRSR